MESAIPPIAIVQGAPSAVVQQLFRDFVARYQATARIAGLVENGGDEAGGDCGPGHLRSISDGQLYPLFQDLGPQSVACALDPGGVVSAGEAVRRGIAAGCDLVVLSKFGKLEAESRSGLIPAFASAIEAGVPVLTSVAPKHNAAWDAFAAPLYTALPADMAVLERWWQAVRVPA